MSYAPRRRATRARMGTRFRLAWVLAVVALSCASWLAWAYVGTTLISHGQQRAALAALGAAWDAHAPSVTRASIAVDGIVRIPRLGASYAVPFVEGTSTAALSLGIGHLVGSARPGGVGNLVLAGHRVTHGEPFRRLPELRVGDAVLVDTETATYVYRITTGGRDLRVPATSTWVLAESPHNPVPDGPGPPAGRRLITLVTCADLFHTADRFVVFGELARTQPRTSPTPSA